MKPDFVELCAAGLGHKGDEKMLWRYAALAAAVAVSFVTQAGAAELTGTLKKIKETGVITIGHRDASIPFSYYDDKQEVVGYSIDICSRVVAAVQKELGLPKLEVKLNPVTSATRIALMANDTVDLECGSTSNTPDRQKQVAFSVATFVTGNHFAAKKASKVAVLNDLKGRTIVSTSGTQNIRQINELNTARKLGMTIIPAKDHAESFLMLQTDRAVAFVMDEVLLAGQVANAKNPDEFMISTEALSTEPYGLMFRKDDPAFKKVVDGAIVALFKSGEINQLYAKWFEGPIPPRGVNLHLPMSAAFKRVIAKPTDSADPAAYMGP